MYTSYYGIYLNPFENTPDPRFLFPITAAEKDECLKLHAESKKPTILVSPAFTMGLDMKDDLCRFQILCKVPYPSLQDKQTKERANIDKDWYANQTALALVQSYGRGVRTEEDWCITYLLDGAMLNYLHYNSRFLQEWFLDAVDVDSIENIL